MNTLPLDRSPLPQWVVELRRTGQANLQSSGFPSRRDEAWKYTDVAGVTKLDFEEHGAPVPPVNISPWLPEEPHVVFIDGVLQNNSLRTLDSSGCSVQTLLSACENRSPETHALLTAGNGIFSDAFTHLNQSQLQEGCCIVLDKNQKMTRPLVLLQVITGRRSVLPRHLITLKSGSEGSVWEIFICLGPSSADPQLCAPVTDVNVGPGASLAHARLLLHGPRDWGYHIGHIRAQVATEGSFESFILANAGKVTRTNAQIRLAGNGARTAINGVLLGNETQVVDQQVRIVHAASHTTSQQTFHGIMDDKAKGVFTGCVVVADDIVKANAQQANHNLLLSATAEMNAKPQLEINSDDVKCSHGMTVGQPRADELFYLRSRGLSPERSLKLLSKAFAAQAVLKIQNPLLKTRIGRELDRIFTWQGLR